MTSKQDMNRNPEGKGGFQDHPELRSDGRWSKDNSFSYWMNFFKAMTVKDFKAYDSIKPEEERTMAEELAYVRVIKSRKELAEFQVLANRTEGMPKEFKSLQVEGVRTLSAEVIEAAEEALKKKKLNE
jgi:hypothetical protein